MVPLSTALFNIHLFIFVIFFEYEIYYSTIIINYYLSFKATTSKAFVFINIFYLSYLLIFKINQKVRTNNLLGILST